MFWLKVLIINTNGSWEGYPNHISMTTINSIPRERTNNMYSEREGMPKKSEKVGHTVSFSIDGEVDAALLYSTALGYEHMRQQRRNQFVDALGGALESIEIVNH